MSGLRVKIHRGARQIGGSCIELESDGQRLVLDLGVPLDSSAHEAALPDVPGLDGGDPSLLGVVLSHAHLDHCGLVPRIAPSVPIAMGSTAARLLREARFFSDLTPAITPTWAMQHGVPRRFGPFLVTSRQVEHSAFDAFALHVEAGGRSLLYSGDLRAHGNDERPWKRLLAEPPGRVDALLLEGTQLGAGRGDSGPGERELRARLAQRLREWPGLVLVAHSSQNIDRVRTVHEAARDAGRRSVVDLYTATMANLAASVNPDVPVLGKDGLRLYARKAERLKVLRAEQFERVDSVKRWRVFASGLLCAPGRFVLQFRPSMVGELKQQGLLEGALAIWSLWRGYLDGAAERAMRAELDALGVPLEVHHVSGHAWVSDLRQLVDALKPGRVVPVHTEAPEAYAAYFPQVELHPDGDWWEV